MMRALIPLTLSFFGGGGGGGGGGSGGGFQTGRRAGRRQQGRTPMNNQAQNRQFNDVVRELGLTRSQAQRLHQEISGQGLGFWDIMQVARDMFGLD